MGQTAENVGNALCVFICPASEDSLVSFAFSVSSWCFRWRQLKKHCKYFLPLFLARVTFMSVAYVMSVFFEHFLRIYCMVIIFGPFRLGVLQFLFLSAKPISILRVLMRHNADLI